MSKDWTLGNNVEGKNDANDLYNFLLACSVNRRKYEFGLISTAQGWAKEQYTKRSRSAVCYAYSIDNGDRYVGYSGDGGQFTVGLWEATKVAERNDRVSHVIDSGEVLDRGVTNCAEASALSTALTYGVQIQKLIFATFHTDGSLMSPCGNCMGWLPEKCRGYYMPVGNVPKFWWSDTAAPWGD